MKASLLSQSIALVATAMTTAPKLTHAFMTPPPRQHAVMRENRVMAPFHDDSCFSPFLSDPVGVAFHSTSTQVSAYIKDITEYEEDINTAEKADQPVEFVPIDNTYGIELTGGKEMNAAGYTGKGIKVAVIDSGIDAEHSGFKEGNVTVVDFYNDAAAKSYFADSLKLHGTHVAGTIHAMAPDANILDYRVFKEVKTTDKATPEEEDKKYTADDLITRAIDHAINESVDIINMSFGTDLKRNETLLSYEAAIQRAVNDGIIIVCSAGDGDGDASTSEKIYPACDNNTISITSIGKGGAYGLQKMGKDASDDSIEYCGIGEDVLSYKPGNKAMKGSGTSFAAAHVTGFIAALLGKKGQEQGSQVVCQQSQGYQNYSEPRNSNDKRDETWLSKWEDIKKTEKKTETLSNLRTLLNQHFVIKIENLGTKSEIGSGFLSYLSKGNLEAKIERYITATYANWGNTFISNAFYEEVLVDDPTGTGKRVLNQGSNG